MKENVDIGGKAGCEGFQDVDLRETHQLIDTEPEKLTEEWLDGNQCFQNSVSSWGTRYRSVRK